MIICNVPPCGSGIYICGMTLFFQFIYIVQLEKDCAILRYVALSGRSSPQYRENSGFFYTNIEIPKKVLIPLDFEADLPKTFYLRHNCSFIFLQGNVQLNFQLQST